MEEQNLTSVVPPTGKSPETSNITASAHPPDTTPMDLSAMAAGDRYAHRGRNKGKGTTWESTHDSSGHRSSCARCGGKGHWSYTCSTPSDWKEGDRIHTFSSLSSSRPNRPFRRRQIANIESGSNYSSADSEIDDSTAVAVHPAAGSDPTQAPPSNPRSGKV